MNKTSKSIHQSESQVLVVILNVLLMIPNSRILRYTGAVIYSPKIGRYIKRKDSEKFQPNGVSDIMFFWDSTSWHIEVKTLKEYNWLMNKYAVISSDRVNISKKDQHAKDQIDWIESIRKTGNKGFFTYSVEHCLEKMGMKYEEVYEMRRKARIEK